MPFDDPWIREGKHSPLDFQRRLFEQTRNPIHVWQAWRRWRELMRDGVEGCETPPPWICEYLDAFAEVMHEWVNGEDWPEGRFEDSLLAALGFKAAGRGVRHTAREAWDRERRDLFVAQGIRYRVVTEPDVSTEAIVADLAALAQVSDATVWRIWRRWRAFFFFDRPRV